MTGPGDRAWEEWREQERIRRGIEDDLRRAEEAERQRQITIDRLAEKDAHDAIAANRLKEDSYSRGAAGGCSQDEENLRRR